MREEVKVCWHPGCLDEVEGMDDYGRFSCFNHQNCIDPFIWFFVLPVFGGLGALTIAISVVLSL